MANRTDPMAKNIRGTNPQNLVGKILRSNIHEQTYWKEQCFGLTADTLVDKAMELDHLGGGGNHRKPTPFMCLVMKMLQIQLDKEIVVEFIKNPEYKYVRALGAFYLRLTGADIDVYSYLEPLYNDYRKLRQKLNDGKFRLTRVDEYVDELLTKDYSCDIALTRINKRWTLEAIGTLEPRTSALEDDFEEKLADGLDYDREREKDRDRHRLRDDKDYGHHERDRDRRERRRSRSRSREEPRKKKEKKADDDPEIAEQNRLRASLGLKPLRV